MRVALLSLTFMVFQNVSFGQVAEYIFTPSNNVYTPIVGGTLIAQATNHTTSNDLSLDQGNYPATIPFTFNINGTGYTTVNVNANGYITFGATLPTTSGTTPISSSTAYSAAVAPMARDLWGVYGTTGTRSIGSTLITGVTSFVGLSVSKPIRGTGIPTGATVTAFDMGAGTITISAAATSASTLGYIGWPIGEIRGGEIGVAPNRVYIIQFSGFSDWLTSVPNNINMDFQIHLAEAGGVATSQTVSFVYGPYTNLSTTARTNQVGLRGSANTDFNNRSSATDWNATVAGGTNSATVTRTDAIFPPSGLTFTWTPPTCFRPTALVVTNISSTSADISWTASAPPPSNGYEWEVRTSGLPGSGGLGLAASGTTAAGVTMAMATSLASDTDHSLYVRGYCGGVDYSIWAGPTNFRTLCAIYSPLYTQDFASYAGAAPTGLACWAEYTDGSPPGPPTGAATSNWLQDGFGNNGSTGAAKIQLSLAVDRDWLVSPVFDLTGGPFQLKSDFALTITGATTQGVFGSDDEVQVLISTDLGASWITLETFNTGNTPLNTGETRIYDLSAYSNMDVVFAFWGNEGTTDDIESVEFFVDNFVVETPPACPPPSLLTATNPTTNGATLGWTESGSSTLWDLEIILASASPTGVPTHTGITVNPYTWSGGMSGTPYKFYVRANCGGSGLSTWSGPQNFTTLITNDEPAGATTLTLNNPISVVTIGATQTLAACTGTADDDVWYAFNPPVNGNYTLAFSGLTGTTDIAYEIFQGLPAGGLSVACHNDPETGASFDGFLSSATYYIRVYSSTSTSSTRITGGTISISNYALTPPSNNECGNALPVTPSTNASCVYTPLNSTDATFSLNKPSCVTTYSPPAHDDDIWVSFTSGFAGDYVFKTSFTGSYGAELYTGGCGALTAVPSSCSSSFTGTTGITRTLAASTPYYLRIWKTGAGGAAFDICIEKPSELPPNCATTPSPPSASIDVTSNECNGTQLISWASGGGNPTNYDVYFGTNSNPPFVVNQTATTYTATGIELNSLYYWKIVPKNMFGDATGCSVWNFTTSETVEYGGPDAGGYFYANSEATTAPSYPTYSFMDPITNGHTLITTFTSGTEDDGYFTIPNIGFPFPFYGTNYQTSNVHISTNGLIKLGTTPPTGTPYGDATIPNTADPDNLIMVAQMDLEGVGTGFTDGQIYYHLAADKLFVTWWHYHDFADATEWITIQAVLESSGKITLNYNESESSVQYGSSTTIGGDANVGIENVDGTIGTAYRINGSGAQIFCSSLAIAFGLSAVALPIDLLSFNAEGMKNYNMITWQTASETNAAIYLVQRSTTINGNFETIGQVEARNSNGESYSFIDHYPKSIGYYRLKMMDLDGQYKFSNTVLVKRTSDRFSILKVYPVPSADVVHVDITNPESIKTGIVIGDITGKAIRTIDMELAEGDQTIQVPLDGLQPGTYFLTILGQVKRIIKL